MDRLQGNPVSKLSDQLDNLTTYQLKIHLWLHRFALVQGDPEEDLEKQAALVSEHVVPVGRNLAFNSRVSGFESWTIDQLSSRRFYIVFLRPCKPVIGHCHFLLYYQPIGSCSVLVICRYSGYRLS
jgi:hypothetical protein